MNNFLSFLGSTKFILSDGAMGTELQKRGLAGGICPEELNISRPEIVKEIHKNYYDAGSDIVETNTFGGNRVRLKHYNFSSRVNEFNIAAVKLINEVRPSGKYIAGSMGPLGELLEPLGEISESQAYDAFAEQAQALEAGGVDIIFIETMMAIDEITIAVKAVKENTKLPVSATMTFELGKAGLRTSWGVDILAAIKALEGLGVDVLGSNCGRGFDEMIEVVKEMKSLTERPILAQANAGLPEIKDGIAVYSETPASIEPKVEKLLESGVRIIGGCCGTEPQHIKKIREIVERYSLKHI